MLVTVYIPTKDRLSSLTTAVESIFSQTFQDFEIIVVNDGSSDGTEAYLANLCSKDLRVRAINNPIPQGAPAARNRAIIESKGKFVTGLDDDDRFLPTRLASFVAFWELLTSNGVIPSCLYSQDVIIQGNGNTRISKKPGHVEYEDLFLHNCLGNQIFTLRTNLIDAGLFDESLLAWQDLEFYMRVIQQHGTAHLLDMATHLFDDSPRPDRISQKSRMKIDTAFVAVAARHAPTNARLRQQLFLQIFLPYYGFRPKFRDWVYLIRNGIWPKGILKLLHATLIKHTH